MKHARHRAARAAAFSLVEVTLALGVAAFSLVAIFGLLPVSFTSSQVSEEQTAAANLALSMAADLREAAAATGTSPRFGFAVPAPGGSSSAANTLYLQQDGTPTAPANQPPVAGKSHYRVSIAFAPPGTSQRNATLARILVTWPASADPDPTQWPTHFVGSYESLTALDRN